LQVNRWYYVREPIYPETDSSGAHFKRRKIYDEILKVVKESPGLTASEIALRIERPYKNLSSFIYNLQRYCGAIEGRKDAFFRTPGLYEFSQHPYAKKLMAKTGSRKTSEPWLRRIFKYGKWLNEMGYYNSAVELLDDYKKITDQEKRYRHIDILQDYLNSFKGDKDYKDSILKGVRAYYRSNRAELPHEKITYDRAMLVNLPSGANEYVRPGEIWKIVNDGHVAARAKAIIACLLCLGTDESTFAEHFNYFGYPQIVKALGRFPEEWDLKKAPVQINLIRSKTQYSHYSFLPAKALELLRDWLNVRRRTTGRDIQIFVQDNAERSDPIFVFTTGNPVSSQAIGDIVRESSFKSGVQQKVPGMKRFRIHGHEFRDCFKTTARIAGMDTAVAEFFIGHNIDSLGYDKSPWVYPEHFRAQYLLFEPFLTGEEQRIELAVKAEQEMRQRVANLESSLLQANKMIQDLTTRLVQRDQLGSDYIGDNLPNGNGHRLMKKTVKPEHLDELLDQGWDPVMNLPDGRILVKKEAV
jgi:hypothetical protein